MNGEYYKINTQKHEIKTLVFKEKDDNKYVMEYLNPNDSLDIKPHNKKVCLTKPVKKTSNIIEDKLNNDTDDITFNDILDLLELGAGLFFIALLILTLARCFF